MKKIIFSLFIVLCSLFNAIAQTPNQFNYQLVVRDNSGNVLSNQGVAFRISLLKNNPSGITVYAEEQVVKTNQFGLANLIIGNGTNQYGSIGSIDWGSDKYFIQVEFKTGAANYQVMGVSQLLSVPYALYAEKSGTGGATGPTGPTGPIGVAGASGEANMVAKFADATNLISSTIYDDGVNSGIGGYNSGSRFAVISNASVSSSTDGAMSIGQYVTFPRKSYYRMLFDDSHIQTKNQSAYTTLYINNLGGAVNISPTSITTTGILKALSNNTDLIHQQLTLTETTSDMPAMVFNRSSGNKLWMLSGKLHNSMDDQSLFKLSYLADTYGDIGNLKTFMSVTGLGDVGIGTTTPAAKLEISSTTSGFLPPRLTTAQMNAIASPVEGLTIYNTDKHGLCFYYTQWNCIGVNELQKIDFPCGNKYFDPVDNNFYKTVQIGTQCWMAENLKTTHYSNGDDIPNVTDNTEWINLTTGAYCDNNNDANNSVVYGRLYNWFTGMDSRKICPTGWHMPTKGEWVILSDLLGGADVSGGKMKEAGTAHWVSPNTGATNESGFTALPSGSRQASDGTFSIMGQRTDWWIPTSYGPDYGQNESVNANSAYFGGSAPDKNNGFSIRCVRD